MTETVENRFNRSTLITGTAVFSALVAAVEYLSIVVPALQFPFPLLPVLKFDLAEVPAMLSFLIFGMPTGVLTSCILPLTIIARGTADLIGPWLKGLAVFSTILGYSLAARKNVFLAASLGTVARVLIMSVVSLILGYGAFVLVVAIFNVIHAVLTLFSAYIICKRSFSGCQC